MSAIQTVDRINFGTARLYETQPGGYPMPVANLTDFSADFKAELKELYSEGGYPIAVADGHRAIDLTAKHATLRPEVLANALGGTTSAGGNAAAIEEAYTVPATSTYTVVLANGTAGKLVPNTLVIVAQPLSGAVPVPTLYKIVTAGAEVAGVSCSVANSTGVVTFAAGDASVLFTATYRYTSTVGTKVTIQNTFQNSSSSYTLAAVKRDVSPLDNSVGQLILDLSAVRTAGIKNEYKEGDFTIYERMYKAYANSAGLVGTIYFVNV